MGAGAGVEQVVKITVILSTHNERAARREPCGALGRFQAGAHARAGEVAVVRSCGPGLLPLVRAGVRLLSRPRRVLEVVVFAVDRSGGVHESRCLSGGPSAETCARRSAVAPCCPAATRSSHRVACWRT